MRSYEEKTNKIQTNFRLYIERNPEGEWKLKIKFNIWTILDIRYLQLSNTVLYIFIVTLDVQL